MSKTGHKKSDYPKVPRLKPITKDRFQNGKIEVPEDLEDDLPNIWDETDEDTDGYTWLIEDEPSTKLLEAVFKKDKDEKD